MAYIVTGKPHKRRLFETARRLAPGFPRDRPRLAPLTPTRPQGAFPWLWEKRPGDEVALTPERYSALSWCTLSNDHDEQKESDHKKSVK